MIGGGSLDRWNFVLNSIDLLAFVALAIVLAVMVRRQRKDLSQQRKDLQAVTGTVKALEDYALLHDEDRQKWRQALKNLARALNVQQVASVLDEPLGLEEMPPEEQPSVDGDLLDERRARSSSDTLGGKRRIIGQFRGQGLHAEQAAWPEGIAE